MQPAIEVVKPGNLQHPGLLGRNPAGRKTLMSGGTGPGGRSCEVNQSRGESARGQVGVKTGNGGGRQTAFDLEDVEKLVAAKHTALQRELSLQVHRPTFI